MSESEKKQTEVKVANKVISSVVGEDEEGGKDGGRVEVGEGEEVVDTVVEENRGVDTKQIPPEGMSNKKLEEQIAKVESNVAKKRTSSSKENMLSLSDTEITEIPGRVVSGGAGTTIASTSSAGQQLIYFSKMYLFAWLGAIKKKSY